MPNYYEILGCSRDASFEEIKRCYHEEVKKVHPDKGNESSQEAFILLQKAWETLSDPSKRYRYNRELLWSDFSFSPLYCALDLSEMDFDPCDEIYFIRCRCGDRYNLHKSEINDAEELRIGCDNCTFHIRVKIVDSDNEKP